VKNRKPRWLRVTLWVVAALVLLVAIAPFLAGTGAVRGLLESAVQSALGRPARVAGLSAGWFSDVTLDGLALENPEGFGGDALLRVRRVRVERGLLGLLLGGGEIRVVVEGAKLSLEERPGGLTNFGDVQAKLFAPREEERPPAKLPPLRIEMRDAEVRYRHVVPRRDPGPADPLVEDPRVLGPDEGVAVLDLEGLAVEVVTSDDGLEASFRSRVTVDGKGGDVEAAVAVSGGVPSGKLVARGFDLEALGPFLPTALGGRVELEAEGAWGAGATVKIDASVKELRPDRASEEWVKLLVEGQRERETMRITAFRLESASGRLSVDGSGTLPLAADAGATHFDVEGRASLDLLGPIAGYGESSGTLRFRGGGTSEGATLDVAGSFGGSAVVLGGHPVSDLEAELRARLDLEAREASIEKLAVKSQGVDASVSGRMGWRPGGTASLAGTGRADLARLFADVRPFLPDVGWSGIEGNATLVLERVERDAGGNLEAKGTLELSDLRAKMPDGEPVARDRVVAQIDARVPRDGRGIEVRAGRLDDLAFEGSARRLEDGSFDGSGKASGTVELSPLFLRLARVRALDDLRGRVTIDASGDASGRLDVAASVDGLALSGTAVPRGSLAQRRVAVTLHAERDGTVWVGGGSLEGDAFKVDAGEVRFVSAKEASGKLAFAARDLAALLALAPPGASPRDLRLAGDLRADASIRVAGDSLVVAGTANSEALTARLGPDGVERESLAARFGVERNGGAWTLGPSEISVAGLRVTPRSASVDDRGAVRFDGTVLFADLARAAEGSPRLAAYRPSGSLLFDGVASVVAGAASAKGKLTGGGLRAAWDDRTFESNEATVELDADFDRAAGSIAVREFAFRTAQGAGSVRGSVTELDGARNADVHFSLDLEPGELGKLDRRIGGEGTCHAEAHITGPLGMQEGRLRVEGGSFQAKSVRYAELELQAATVDFEGTASLAGARLDAIDLLLDAKAAAVGLGENRLTAVRVNQSAKGRLAKGSPVFVTGSFVCRRAFAGELPIDDVRVTFDGTLPSREPGGDPPWTAKGSIRFARASGQSMDWRDGVANLELMGTRVTLTELEAILNGGTVKGSATLDFAAGKTKWESDLVVEKVTLDQRLGEPLSFLIPILRLESHAHRDRKLEGTVGATLKLAGEGTSQDALMRALRGEGQIRLADVNIRGSILLNLLALRVDRALSGTDYSVRDIVVDYKVADGRVTLTPFVVDGAPFKLGIDGSTGLDGSLDLAVSLGARRRLKTPLGEIESPFKVGVGIRGTFGDPSMRPIVLNKKFFEDIFK